MHSPLLQGVLNTTCSSGITGGLLLEKNGKTLIPFMSPSPNPEPHPHNTYAHAR